MTIENDIRQAKTTDERIKIAHDFIRKEADKNIIPLISEGKASLDAYGDFCFALGYLRTYALRGK